LIRNLPIWRTRDAFILALSFNTGLQSGEQANPTHSIDLSVYFSAALEAVETAGTVFLCRRHRTKARVNESRKDIVSTISLIWVQAPPAVGKIVFFTHAKDTLS